MFNKSDEACWVGKSETGKLGAGRCVPLEQIDCLRKFSLLEKKLQTRFPLRILCCSSITSQANFDCLRRLKRAHTNSKLAKRLPHANTLNRNSKQVVPQGSILADMNKMSYSSFANVRKRKNHQKSIRQQKSN